MHIVKTILFIYSTIVGPFPYSALLYSFVLSTACQFRYPYYTMNFREYKIKTSRSKVYRWIMQCHNLAIFILHTNSCMRTPVPRRQCPLHLKDHTTCTKVSPNYLLNTIQIRLRSITHIAAYSTICPMKQLPILYRYLVSSNLSAIYIMHGNYFLDRQLIEYSRHLT